MAVYLTDYREAHSLPCRCHTGLKKCLARSLRYRSTELQLKSQGLALTGSSFLTRKHGTIQTESTRPPRSLYFNSIQIGTATAGTGRNA